MSRIINFFDGATSGSVPTSGSVTASNLTQYANDAAFEAAVSGAPVVGNIYYNTTDNRIRWYNGSAWDVIDKVTSVNGQTGAAVLDSDDVAEGVSNLYNQTHTGEVTGSVALTVDKTVITNKTGVVPATGDHFIITDATDSDNLKKVSFTDLVTAVGTGGLTVFTLSDVEAAGNGGTSITANTTNIDWTEISDTNGNWNGTAYVAARDEKVMIDGAISTTTSNTLVVAAYINGVYAKSIGISSVSRALHPFSGAIKLLSGESLTFRIDKTMTLNNSTANHHLSISALPDTRVEE